MTREYMTYSCMHMSKSDSYIAVKCPNYELMCMCVSVCVTRTQTQDYARGQGLCLEELRRA